MSTCSTHVLDAALGLPGAGLTVALFDPQGRQLGNATTDDDGRIRFESELGEGTHGLVFETGAWFAEAGRATLYPEIAVSFAIDPEQGHYHVALLLSPFSYTTYRGS